MICIKLFYFLPPLAMKKSMSCKSRHYSYIYRNCPNNNQNIKHIFHTCQYCGFSAIVMNLALKLQCYEQQSFYYGYLCITSSASFPWLDSNRGQLHVLEYSNNKRYNDSDVKLLSSFSWLVSCRTFGNISLNECIVNMSADSPATTKRKLGQKFSLEYSTEFPYLVKSSRERYAFWKGDFSI